MEQGARHSANKRHGCAGIECSRYPLEALDLVWLRRWRFVMQMRKGSRALVTFQRRLEQRGNDRPEGGVQLRREDVAALIEALQSTNAELHSINRELEEKNKALARLNSDLQHLLDNIDVAVLFVDDELRITRFTPPVTRIFPLRASDRGRRLTDFSSKLRNVDLAANLAHVLQSGVDIEREVRIEADHKSQALLMRVRASRTLDGTIDGIVLSFFDVDTITVAAHAETARYAALSRASGDAILGLSLDGIVNAWSRGAERLLGYTSDEMVGKHIAILASEGLEGEQRALLEPCAGTRMAASCMYPSGRRQFCRRRKRRSASLKRCETSPIEGELKNAKSCSPLNWPTVRGICSPL